MQEEDSQQKEFTNLTEYIEFISEGNPDFLKNPLTPESYEELQIQSELMNGTGILVSREFIQKSKDGAFIVVADPGIFNYLKKQGKVKHIDLIIHDEVENMPLSDLTRFFKPDASISVHIKNVTSNADGTYAVNYYRHICVLKLQDVVNEQDITKIAKISKNSPTKFLVGLPTLTY